MTLSIHLTSNLELLLNPSLPKDSWVDGPFLPHIPSTPPNTVVLNGGSPSLTADTHSPCPNKLYLCQSPLHQTRSPLLSEPWKEGVKSLPMCQLDWQDVRTVEPWSSVPASQCLQLISGFSGHSSDLRLTHSRWVHVSLTCVPGPSPLCESASPQRQPSTHVGWEPVDQ